MGDGYHHGNLKEQLILAGMEIITKEGVGALSIRKAAEKCSVSHAAPYSHFKNKEEYLKKINEFAEEKFAKALEESLEYDKGDMVEMAKAYVRFFIKNPTIYDFYMCYADFNIEIGETEIKSRNSRAFDVFKEAADKYMERLDIPREKRAVNIIRMWVMVQGITMLAVMSGIKCETDWEEYTKKILKEAVV